MAEAGDTLVLAANSGPYHESFSLVGSRYSGAAQPFTIRGNGAILDGTMPVQPEAWEPYQGTVFRFQPRLAGYQQLYLDGRPAPRVTPAPLAQPVPPRALAGSASAMPPPLRAGQWCLCGGMIYFAVEGTKLPRDYDLRAAGRETGITLYHVDRVVISGLIVQGFHCDGISAFNSARDIELTGVTCRGNGRAGISVGGAFDRRDQPDRCWATTAWPNCSPCPAATRTSRERDCSRIRPPVGSIRAVGRCSTCGRRGQGAR